MRGLGVLASSVLFSALCASVVQGPGSASAKGDLNCDDFDNQAQAQQVLGTYKTREKARQVEAEWTLSQKGQETRSCRAFADFWLKGYHGRTKASSYTTAASAIRHWLKQYEEPIELRENWRENWRTGNSIRGFAGEKRQPTWTRSRFASASAWRSRKP